MIKNRKICRDFKGFRHKSLVFTVESGSFAVINEIMMDDIRYLHIFGRLMTGKNIEDCDIDPVKADNILYRDFGMSAEEIMKKLKSGNEGLCVNNCG